MKHELGIQNSCNTTYTRNTICFKRVTVNSLHIADIQHNYETQTPSSHIRSSLTLRSLSPHSEVTIVTHLPFPVPLLPVTGRSTAVLLLQMFPTTVGKSKLSFVLSELSNFYDSEKLGMFRPEQTSAGHRDTAL